MTLTNVTVTHLTLTTLKKLNYFSVNFQFGGVFALKISIYLPLFHNTVSSRLKLYANCATMFTKGAAMKVLIVDDEIKLADALGEVFRRYKFLVDVVYDGEDGYFYAQNGDYDVVVLDVMMPNMDGFQVVQKLREAKCNVPILMLTAKDDVSSRVKGLDCGADDYLTKPFATEELLARVRALSRRQSERTFDSYSYCDTTLNAGNYTLSCGEKSVALGAKEYEIMRLLISNPTQVISKDTIISKVWGLDSDITENNVEAYMSFLRKKLLYIGSKLTISSKRLLGYFLESEN